MISENERTTDQREDASPQPICTIAIPVYNREEMVKGAIESALRHSQANLEILVIDNCSTDQTYEVASSYQDSRLKVYRNESNIGLFGNFNRCLELAKGKYVCILCSDDRHNEGFLDKALPAMEAHPSAGILTTRQRMVDIEGNFLRTEADHFQPGLYDGKEAIRAFLRFQAHYAFNVFSLPSGCLFRKSVIDQIEPFPTQWKIVGDVELYLRALERSDLVAMDIAGVTVTYHMGQEWALTYGDTARVHEHFFLLERYQSLLGPDLYRRCVAQTCAITMALAMKFRLKGNKKASAEHWELAISKGVGPIGRWVAFSRLVWLRTLFKLLRHRSLPQGPKSPLEAAG